MNPELFIRRPVMTWLVMAGILVFGIFAYRLLPVSDLPNVDFPTIQVAASLPGASPDTMASAVATPLERQFSTIAGIDSMTSSSALGLTQITVQFSLERNIDAAAQDVQAAIAAAAPQLPPGMPTPPSYKKVNPADQPVLYLALSSPTLPLYTVDEYAQTNLAQRISPITGVAQVQVFGSQKYAVRVQLDPNALATRGIGIDEVQKALAQSNVNLPTGTLYGPYQAFSVQATGQLTNAAAYRPLIVAYRNGSPVRLEQLGRVVDSVQTDKVASWYNDDRSVILAIQRQPGTNTIEVVDSIRKILPVFQSQLPASVKLSVLYDRSVSIRDSVHDVQFTLLLAIALVVLVIFLFLRNVSATIIPSLALPMSIVGTFVVMYVLGYTIDNLSLMALTLAVGFIVDDAIVMLENIVRHMEMGEGRMEAALNGAREIGFTIVSMTLSLAAVFLPVLFMGGVVGRLLHEFAVVIGASVLVSGFVSLTLTPMACSRFLRHGRGSHGRLYAASERVFDGMLGVYERTLKVAMRHARFTLGVFVLTLVATAYLFTIIPKGFIPNEDTGQVFAFTEAAQDISFDSMIQHQRAVAAIVKQQPYVDNFMSSIGAGGPNVVANTGRIFMRLKPREEPAVRRRDRPGPPEEARRHPGHERLPPGAAHDQDRGPAHQGPLPVHAPGRRPRDALPLGAGALRQAPRAARLPRRQLRSADHEPPGAGRDRPGQGLGARRHGGADRERAQQCLWLAPGLDDLHADQPVLGDDGAPARVPAGSRRPRHALRPRLERQARPAQRGGQAHAHGGPAHHQSPGPAPRGDHLVQPEARGGARRRGGRGEEDGAGAAAARHAQHELPGHGAGVPALAPGARPAHPGRHPPDLPDPRHPVRELPAPADHPVGAAVGGRGRPPHAHPVQPGAQPVRLRRHHHAGGHREEERHHDDRLRHRCPARGQARVRGDLRGLPPALPPDHDDDHGRPHGDAAHRRRHRRGGRCAPEPRPRRGRRPRALAAPDALHHPRHLPLPGSRPRAARPPASRHDERGGPRARAAAQTSSPS